MKKLIVQAVMLLTVISVIAAQTVQDTGELPFEYDSTKTSIGTAFFYSVKNMDKNQEYEIIIWQKDETTFMSCFDISDIVPQIQTGQQIFDTRYFCYNYASNRNPFAYARIRNTNDTVELMYDLDNKTARGTITVTGLFRNSVKYEGSLTLSAVPTYEVSGLQLDFAYAMRFYNGDHSAFTTGCHTALKDFVQTVEYVGVDLVDGTLCDKWKAVVLQKNGKPSKETQIFWFDKTDSCYTMVKSEAHISGSVFTNSLLELTETRTFTEAGWNRFIAERTEAVRQKLKIAPES